MSDDHAAHAISAYGSAITTTPNLDRIADGGMRFDACFCTNSICAPSRAAILTGTYNHVNGVTTLDTPLDNRSTTFPALLRGAGYQTALFGKWHLGHGPAHDPVGFDTWRVLPGQGHYHDPVMLAAGGEVIERGGYVTDLITDDCIDWLAGRDRTRPFALLCHHKAPHRTWEPDGRRRPYLDADIAAPPTMFDDHATRSAVVRAVRMGLGELLPHRDLGGAVPEGLDAEAELRWRYQQFITRYLHVVASLDENIGRLLDALDAEGVADDTIVVYTSDQGFFLGDHGWFDKRLMYEESLRMPLLVRYPRLVREGSVCKDIVVNVDLAPTFLDLAGVEAPATMQGRSAAPLLRGEHPADWPTSMYYRYWMHRDGAHRTPAHYGVRTHRHKLICFYNDPLGQPGANGPADPVEWELYDLVADPSETTNIIATPEGRAVADDLYDELCRWQADVADEADPSARLPS